MRARKSLVGVVLAGAFALWSVASASADVAYVTTLSSGVHAVTLTFFDQVWPLSFE